MDTTTPQGAFLFSVFGALAQYERALTQERIKAGLAAARRRGKRGGRPQAISDEKLTAIRAALDGGASKAAIRPQARPVLNRWFIMGPVLKGCGSGD